MRIHEPKNLAWTNGPCLDIDYSETDAKRVMLIGTAILTPIGPLISVEKFNDDGQIRSIGFILGLLLQFTLYFKQVCVAHKDGWQVSVVKKADEYGVTIRSLDSIGLLVDRIAAILKDASQKRVEVPRTKKSGSQVRILVSSKPTNQLRTIRIRQQYSGTGGESVTE